MQQNRDDLQYERGTKQYERVMKRHKNPETIDTLTLYREALDKLKPGKDGKLNPSLVMSVFYAIARAREGGRLTEQDFARTFGFQDLLTKAKNYLKTGFQAELSDQQIEWTTNAIKKEYQAAVEKMERNQRAALRLLDKLPEGARRQGVQDTYDTDFGDLAFHQTEVKRMQNESKERMTKAVSSGKALLQKLKKK